MARAVDIIAGAGVENAAAIVAASNDTGLPLGVAMGMVMKETGGANVYGHDRGGACSGWGQVTEDNFRNSFLPVVLSGGTSNGVGPTQITYPGYFRQNPGYPWWDPYANCVVGFNLLKGYCGGDYSDASLVAAGSTYNSGSPTGTASTYGRTFAALAEDWTARLAGASTDVDMNDLGGVPDVQLSDVVTRPDGTETSVGAILGYLDQRIEGLYRIVRPGDGRQTDLPTIAGWLDQRAERLESVVCGGGIQVRNVDGSDAGRSTDIATEAGWLPANVRALADAASRLASSDEVRAQIEELVERLADAYRSAQAGGDRSAVPEPGSVAAAALAAGTVVVQAGQTLREIAEAHGSTVQAIVDATPGLEPNDLVAGQKIFVPAGSNE